VADLERACQIAQSAVKPSPDPVGWTIQLITSDPVDCPGAIPPPGGVFNGCTRTGSRQVVVATRGNGISDAIGNLAGRGAPPLIQELAHEFCHVIRSLTSSSAVGPGCLTEQVRR
jgi:hypothetical protein